MTKSPLDNQNLPAYCSEDNINLVDLWLALVKRKLILAGIVIVCTAAGFLYTKSMPRTYQYSTTIEIATFLNIAKLGDSKLTVLELPETVRAKVKENYIPLAQQDYLKKNPGQKSVIKIDARIPKRSQVVLLSSMGPKSEGEAHKAMQQSVVDMLKKDHDHIIDVLSNNPEIHLVNLGTRALLPPMRSLGPTGPGSTLIILLSLVSGLMLGVFAVFFTEFLTKVRNQLKLEQNT